LAQLNLGSPPWKSSRKSTSWLWSSRSRTSQRGENNPHSPPIKVWAEKNNIRVEQPLQISNLKSEIFNLKPDLIVVAAYGQILPKEILEIPKFKSINIHGSLLPKYRGASPIQAAILNRDAETGITLIQMDEKMDHGPVISKEVVRLDGSETYPELYKN